MLRDDFFEKIQSHFDSQLPFVAYRKPKGNVIKSVLQQDSRIHRVVDFTENGFVFAPFDAHEKGILFPTAYSQTITAEVGVIESDPEELSRKGTLLDALNGDQ